MKVKQHPQAPTACCCSNTQGKLQWLHFLEHFVLQQHVPEQRCAFSQLQHIQNSDLFQENITMNSPVWPSANLKLLLLLKMSNESYFQTVEILLPPLCLSLFYQAPLQLAQKSSSSSSQLSVPPSALSRNLQEASALVHQQCLHTEIVLTSFSPAATKCPWMTRITQPVCLTLHQCFCPPCWHCSSTFQVAGRGTSSAGTSLFSDTQDFLSSSLCSSQAISFSKLFLLENSQLPT